jgi:hypothetical protein
MLSAAVLGASTGALGLLQWQLYMGVVIGCLACLSVQEGCTGPVDAGSQLGLQVDCLCIHLMTRLGLSTAKF